MKYPFAIRFLHWTMALIIAGQLLMGAIMVRLDDAPPLKFDQLYPLHKSFGLLVAALFVLRLSIRATHVLPALPEQLAGWEKRSAKLTHAALYVLMIVVPVFGYSMSSTFTQSDGVTFFGVPVPELLPKNDDQFAVFQWLHRVSAYLLLAFMVMHIAAVIKHRFFERDRANDVLPRML